LNAVPTLNGPKVLLVEDDATLRELLRRTIDRGGFTVVTAANGHEALARFHETTFQTVVTDLLMPEMDGFEVIRQIRQESPDVVIIAISGIDDPAVFQRLVRQLGADATMTKPVAYRELVALLNTAYSRSAAQSFNSAAS
jgi:two-component system, OmpR family, response regulator